MALAAAGKLEDKDQDATDWRERYYRETLALDADLKRWRQLAEDLQYLTRQLCRASHGQSGPMNEILDRITAQLKREPNGDFSNLTRQLTDAVRALDTAPARPTEPAGAKVEDAQLSELSDGLVRLIDTLQFAESLEPQARKIADRLANVDDLTAVIRDVDALAGLASAQLQHLSEAVDRLQGLFQTVTSRLDDIFGHLDAEEQAYEAAQSSRKDLDASVHNEVQGLGASVRDATNLEQLQDAVDARLKRISAEMQAFKAREDAAETAHEARAEALRARCEVLESNSRTLEAALLDQQKQAQTDALTGVANRLGYQRQAPVYLKRCHRFGRELIVGVTDIDHFKAVNDHYGHRAGDRAIQLVAKTLSGGLRDTDLIARYGGDEFVLLLEGIGLSESARLISRMVRKVAGLPMHYNAKPVAITVSCGLAQVGQDDSLDAAFERADKALYEAKRAGRNRVCVN